MEIDVQIDHVLFFSVCLELKQVIDFVVLCTILIFEEHV